LWARNAIPHYLCGEKSARSETYVVINNDINCNSTADENGTYVYNGTTISSTSAGGSTDITTVITLTNSDLKTDFTETSSGGTVFKNVAYFKKIN
jgi:hypothetical protein